MSKFPINCTGVILAGGENRRMPVLKAFIEVEGQKIIERNLDIMKQCFKNIFIITNQPEKYSYLNVPMLGDAYNVRGPMTGIFTALLNSPDRWIFVSACDMPFINSQVIKYMASKRSGFDAIIPISSLPSSTKAKAEKDYTEPLFAFYSTRLLPALERAVNSNNRSLRDFLKNKRVQYISTGQIKELDNSSKSFINLNTPEDIEHFLDAQDIMKYNRKARRRIKCSD